MSITYVSLLLLSVNIKYIPLDLPQYLIYLHSYLPNFDKGAFFKVIVELCSAQL